MGSATLACVVACLAWNTRWRWPAVVLGTLFVVGVGASPRVSRRALSVGCAGRLERGAGVDARRALRRVPARPRDGLRARLRATRPGVAASTGAVVAARRASMRLAVRDVGVRAEDDAARRPRSSGRRFRRTASMPATLTTGSCMKLMGVSAETSPSFSARVHSMWPPVPRSPRRPPTATRGPAATARPNRAGTSDIGTHSIVVHSTMRSAGSVADSCLIWIDTMPLSTAADSATSDAAAEARRARPHDHQHAHEAHQHGGPAARAHLLVQERHRRDGHEQRRGIGQRRSPATAAGAPIAQKLARTSRRCRSGSARSSAAAAWCAAGRGRAAAAAAAPPPGRRSCGRTRSRRYAALDEARRIATAISPKNSVLASISTAARMAVRGRRGPARHWAAMLADAAVDLCGVLCPLRGRIAVKRGQRRRQAAAAWTSASCVSTSNRARASAKEMACTRCIAAVVPQAHRSAAVRLPWHADGPRPARGRWSPWAWCRAESAARVDARLPGRGVETAEAHRRRQRAGRAGAKPAGPRACTATPGDRRVRAPECRGALRSRCHRRFHRPARARL